MTPISELSLAKARVTIRDPAKKRPERLGKVTLVYADGIATASRRTVVFASGPVDTAEQVAAKAWRFTLGEIVWDVTAGCGCGGG